MGQRRNHNINICQMLCDAAKAAFRDKDRN